MLNSKYFTKKTNKKTIIQTVMKESQLYSLVIYIPEMGWPPLGMECILVLISVHERGRYNRYTLYCQVHSDTCIPSI